MPTYRRKPVEAVQWFKEGDHPLVKINRNGFAGRMGAAFVNSGPHVQIILHPGDWVVVGENGRWPTVYRDKEFRDQFDPSDQPSKEPA